MRSAGRRLVVGLLAGARRCRSVLLLLPLALLPGSVSGDTGGAPGAGTHGVRVTKEVPFAAEAFEAIRPGAQTGPARRIASSLSTGSNGA